MANFVIKYFPVQIKKKKLEKKINCSEMLIKRVYLPALVKKIGIFPRKVEIEKRNVFDLIGREKHFHQREREIG